MTRYARPLILALAAVVLAASAYALYVHYRLVQDPTYTSACEVSATVSCQQVFTSPYGSAFGIPVAAGGAIWASLVLLLGVAALRARTAEFASRMVGYIFVLATVGLAAVFYYAYASYFVLGVTCPVCMTMYVGIIGIFVASASASAPLGQLGSKLGQDIAAIRRSTAAQTLAAAWVVAVIALIVFFPREQAFGTVSAAGGAAPPPPLEQIAPEQRAEFEQWLDEAHRHDEARPEGDVRVRVVKFNDYQCPSCRQAYVLYQHIFDRYEAEYPGVFVFDKRDFPLEGECGFGGQHMAACEAAAAVRMAQEGGRGREMADWLYEHQAGLTRDRVKEGLEQVAQITDFDERYQDVVKAVRTDAELGDRLGVQGTPTLFLNGVQMPPIRPAFWDLAIRHELRKAGVDVPEPEAGE